jgi:ankyrin repeat protein
MSFFWGDSPNEVKRRDDIKKMFKFASTKNNRGVYAIIKQHSLDLNSDECKDDYQNSLLHIAVNSCNKPLVTQLLKLKVSTHHKNNFNEIPVDLAIKNNDLDIVRMLESNSNDKIIQLEADNQVLTDEIVKLTAVNSDLNTRFKRQRDECLEHDATIKKLKTDNAELEKTVNNLRGSFKK